MAKAVNWIEAARLRTLPLAISGLALGNLLALSNGVHNPAITFFSILTAFFLQVLSNYANDYGDFVNGADNDERIGPKRAVQAGDISPNSMKRAIFILIFLSLLSGITLLWFSIAQVGLNNVLIVFAVGLLSIAAAVSYTATSKPYGYMGLGDLAVFIFFGLVAVNVCFFLQTGEIKAMVFMPAAAFGLLSTAVLNLNNIRDIETDKKAGKNTVAVALGLKKAVLYHHGLVIMAIALFALYAIFSYSVYYQYLFLAPTILLLWHLKKVNHCKTYSEFNPLLKELSLKSALLAISLGASLNI